MVWWGNLNPFLQFSTSDSILEARSKNYTILQRLCYGFHTASPEVLHICFLYESLLEGYMSLS